MIFDNIPGKSCPGSNFLKTYLNLIPPGRNTEKVPLVGWLVRWLVVGGFGGFFSVSFLA